MRIFLKAWLLALLAACGTDVKIDNHAASKAKAVPVVREMLEIFHAQNDRLQFIGCEFDYNGRRFTLGMSVEQIATILGPYDYFNRGYYVWKNAGVVLASTKTREEAGDAILDVGEVNFNLLVDKRDLEKYKHLLENNQNYVLFNGVPVDKDTTIRSFFDLSEYEYSDAKISSHSYQFDESCQNSSAIISYYFDASGGWNYEGEGHLRYKTTVNRNNSNTISRIAFQFSKD